MFRQKCVVLVALVCVSILAVTVFAGEEEAIRDGILEELTVLVKERPEILLKVIPLMETRYLKAGKINEAIALYKKALAILPDNEGFLDRLGNLYIINKEHKKVIAVYRKMTKLYPQNIRYLNMLSNAYYDAGDKEEALALWEDLMQKVDSGMVLGSEDIAYLKDTEPNYMMSKRFKEAELICNIILKTTKDKEIKEWAVLDLIYIYKRNGRLGDLAARFLEELAMAPEDINKYDHLTLVYGRGNEDDKMIEVYEKALSSGVLKGEIQNRLLVLYRQFQKFDKAEALIEGMMDASSDDLSLYEQKTSVLYQAGKIDEARDTWREFLTKVPNDAILLSRMAEALIGWGDLDSAIELFRKAQSLDSKNLFSTLRIADILIHREQFDEARKELKSLIARTTDDGLKQAAKERLEHIKEIQQVK